MDGVDSVATIVVPVPSNPTTIIQTQRPNPYLGERRDILMNPYTPPLKQPEGLLRGGGAGGFTQTGMLTAVQKGGVQEILPLFSRQLDSSRDYYQYYTMNNQLSGGIKLPIISNGKSGLVEYGVREIFTGDTVTVEGLDAKFKVYVYDTQQIRYLG